MTEVLVGSVMGSGAVTPFRTSLMRKQDFRKRVEHVEVVDPEENVIKAPRRILLGRLLDKETGEDIGPFYLPLDDMSHEPSILIEGGSGTGKSVALSRIFSEFIFTGRSGIICDFKGQYSVMKEPNKDPHHIKILKEFDEEPMGLGDIDVWLPNHIVIRNGETFCRNKYNYNKKFTIRTEDMDAGGLLMLGGKATEGRDYVQTFDALLTRIRVDAREGNGKYDLQTILSELEDTKREIPAKKRSIDVIEAMLDNLMSTGVIADDGNAVTELIEKPIGEGNVGKVSIFNTGAAGPNDIQSRGVIANFINGLCYGLMNDFEQIDGKMIGAYRPVFAIEEASTYFSSSSSPMVLSAFELLQYVMGRTLGICRIYVYQHTKQMPSGLKDSDSMPIYIKLKQSLILTDEYGNKTSEINDKGLAEVSIKNVSFMSNQSFFVRILPPKCNVRS